MAVGGRAGAGRRRGVGERAGGRARAPFRDDRVTSPCAPDPAATLLSHSPRFEGGCGENLVNTKDSSPHPPQPPSKLGGLAFKSPSASPPRPPSATPPSQTDAPPDPSGTPLHHKPAAATSPRRSSVTRSPPRILTARRPRRPDPTPDDRDPPQPTAGSGPTASPLRATVQFATKLVVLYFSRDARPFEGIVPRSASSNASRMRGGAACHPIGLQSVSQRRASCRRLALALRGLTR